MAKGEMFEKECKEQIGRQRELAGSIVVHGGLFFGDYLPLCSALAGTHGLVLGFEPVSRNVQYSRLTAAANNLSNVQIKHACMSNQTRTTSMCSLNSQGKEVGGQGAVDASTAACQPQATRCEAIDDVVKSSANDMRVGLLVLDTEGHEVEALRGALGTLTRWKPLVATELEIATSVFWQSSMRPLGYRKVGHCIGELSRFVHLKFYDTGAEPVWRSNQHVG